MSKKQNAAKAILDTIANETIRDRDVVEEFEEGSLNYAVKTIIDRALPDARDGLKPAQRRILFAMDHYLNLKPSGKFMKSARVSGEVMGKLHPHGSSYGVAVNMASEFSVRYPTIDPQGNFGFPLDGDGPAADRYTEMRLSELGMAMVKDVDKKVVDFKPNYDEEEEEPVVLPAAIPYLLMNGATGIATGYTTEFPSQNLNEIVDALIALIKNSELTTRDLMKYVKGPDLESGGYLIDNENIFQLYETGKASLKFRAKIEKEYQEDGSVNLVISQLPPDLKKGSTDSSAGIVEKIANLCLTEKKIPRVADVRDESSTKRDKITGKFIGSPVRIVIELQKTAIPDAVIAELYKQTSLEKTKGFLMRAIVNQSPVTLTLKDAMVHYIEHRRDVVFRKIQYDLNATKKKLHIAEGFRKVFDDLDRVIEIIRNSQNPDKDLMTNYGLSKEQTAAVLDMKLRKLSKLEENKLDNEIAQLRAEIEKLEYILSNALEIDKIIVSDLKDIKKQFGDDRKTIVVAEGDATQNFNQSETMVVIVTSKNQIKQIPETAYNDMIKNGALRERNEVYTQAVRCTTSDEFIIFTNTGEYVRVGFSDLLGQLDFLDDKKISALIVVDNEDDKKQVIVATAKGMIKKSGMQAFRARARRLAPYMNLADDDSVVSVMISDGNEKNTIVVATNKGTIHRFYEKVFSSSNPGGNGVPCISPDVIKDGENIVDIAILSEDKDSDSLIVLYVRDGEDIYEKSMSMDEFRTKGRVSKGIVGAGVDLKGELFDIKVAENDFMIIDKKGTIHTQKFVSIPIQSRYNKPVLSEIATLVTDFFK